MKGWLGRAIAGTVSRGDDPENQFTRWSRPLAPTPPVDAQRFQAADEPFPGHWRADPAPWAAGAALPSGPVVRAAIKEGLAALPPRWAEVVRRRDVAGASPVETAAAVGVTEQQQRDILNRARALLRERIARAVHRSAP
jgi:RNA polymerase sigma-70 factor (ECF subfamily)